MKRVSEGATTTLYRQPMDGSAIFRADATFCSTTGKSGTGTSFPSDNYRRAVTTAWTP